MVYASVYGFDTSVQKTRDPDLSSGKETVIYSTTGNKKKQRR